MAIDREKLAMDFKERLDAVFQGQITFSFEDYVNSNTKIKFYCKEHNESFSRSPAETLVRHGCKECKKDKYKRKNTESVFLKDAKEKHGDSFDYSYVDFTGYDNKIKIRCVKHNEIFLQTPANHLRSQGGCPSCKLETIAGHHRNDKYYFVQKAKEVHGDKYIYDNVEYMNCDTKVEIYCTLHKQFFRQSPYNHCNLEHGCPLCARERQSNWGDNCLYKTDRNSNLYLVELFDGFNHFIKVGLSVNPKRRWGDLHRREIQFVKPIMLLEGPANKLSAVENKVLWRSGLDKYSDENWTWAGRTECFFMEDAYKIIGIISDEFEKQQLGG